MTTAGQVVRRRLADREALLAQAQAFAEGLPPDLRVRAVVVFGSVARGDFHTASDIDVLVIGDRLPRDVLARQRALGRGPSRVQPLAWTTAEWRRELGRHNPLAIDAELHGVWLVGGPPQRSRIEPPTDSDEAAVDT